MIGSGDRIVVRTPDRREFRGRLVEIRDAGGGRATAVVRLDTGWVTSYPLDMVERDEAAEPPDRQQ
jgi:hypothetical protein